MLKSGAGAEAKAAEQAGKRSAIQVNPAGLLRWFVLVSLLSVVLILALVGYGSYSLYRHLTISDAQNASVGIGRALIERERDLFVSTAGGTPQIVVDPANFTTLDDRMRKYLAPFSMYKIKVFAADKKIVYSTDRTIINKVDDKNDKLARTLTRGEILPNLAQKDKITDLGRNDKFNVDVVETYLPIRDENGFIIGAFEVYTDVSAGKKQLTPILALALTVALGVTVLMIVLLFIPMRRGMFELMDAQDALQRFGGPRPAAR